MIRVLANFNQHYPVSRYYGVGIYPSGSMIRNYSTNNGSGFLKDNADFISASNYTAAYTVPSVKN